MKTLRYSKPRGLIAAFVLAVIPAVSAFSASSTDLLGTGTNWYRSDSGFSGGSSGVSGGTLTYAPASEGGEMISYFATQSLSVGETLTLNFTYTITGAVNNRADSLRIGLFNSNGSEKVSVNSFSSANAENYTGYLIASNPGSTTSTTGSVRFRDESDNALLIGGNASGLPATLTTGGNQRATLSTSYSGFLSITRLDATSAKIEYSFGGDSIILTDSTFNQTSFDSVGIFYGKLSSASATTLSISSLTLGISSIPEPSAAVALAGVGVLLVAGLRRRYR